MCVVLIVVSSFVVCRLLCVDGCLSTVVCRLFVFVLCVVCFVVVCCVLIVVCCMFLGCMLFCCLSCVVDCKLL